MPSILGAVRRGVLAPSLASVTLEGRGFPGAAEAAAKRLGTIPQSVVCGFEWGIADRRLADTVRRLELVGSELRGFAYEGATMACVIRDTMPPGGNRTRTLLAGAGRPHILLNYIGVGFALARLPRPAWRRALPELTDPELYPRMSWLAVDGYGFDRAYFDTAKWIQRQYRPRPYAWDGDRDYFPRAVDQGVGRALWFIHGADTSAVAASVGRFAHARRADLWSGIGLAATFAGGAGGDRLAALRAEAGMYADQVGLGAVFAAKARHMAGAVPEYTHAAVRALAGLSVASAAELADEGGAGMGVADSRIPVYEQWRTAVRSRLTELSAFSE
ncbi:MULTISPECIES: DUF1702 family protein [unclassified Streptomyces]|uniref:DUF1702 family protein n=1 Tax=unclassified Streptomyces TaxID=2593676 RepID=UPI000CD54BCF|nr:MULTISPECIES: DUF1702 family protein [unclassified Streptomyces]